MFKELLPTLVGLKQPLSSRSIIHLKNKIEAEMTKDKTKPKV